MGGGPSQVDGLERHIPQVHIEQATAQKLAHISQQLDGFYRAHVANSSGYSPEHRELTTPRFRIIGIQTGKASGLTGNESGEMSPKFIQGTLHHRLALLHALLIEQKAFTAPDLTH